MIATMVCTRRPEFWHNVIENLNRQTVQPDLIVVVYAGDWKPDILPHAPKVIFKQDEPGWSLPHKRLWAMEQIVKQSNVGLALHFDDDDRYGFHYIEEAMAALAAHPDAAIIGKARYYTNWIHLGLPPILSDVTNTSPEGKVFWVAGPSIAINIAKWIEHPGFRYDPEDVFDDRGLIRATNALQLPIYTTSPENFFYQRYDSTHNHLWHSPEPV
jgi:hypothetical protein